MLCQSIYQLSLPQERRTINWPDSWIFRAGSVGSKSRCIMAAAAAAPILRQGWRTVVKGTGNSLAYLTSSTPNDTNVLGNTEPDRQELLHQVSSDQVVGAQIGFRRICHQLLKEVLVLDVTAPYPALLELNLVVQHRVAVAGDPQVVSGGSQRVNNEVNPSATKLQKMVAQQIADLTVVDAHQVILAPGRKRFQIAVQ